MSLFSPGGRTVCASILALGALALSGCSGVATLPDTDLPGSSAQPGAIQGSLFGGHAPIVGSHIYILQASTSGYAAASTNLMTSGSAGSDTHGNYVLTDANGNFNVTGDYTCTTGLPVYLAGTGGQTSTNIGGSSYSTSPITITSATSASVGGGQYLLTFTGNNLLYPGQSVTLSGLTGAWAGFDGLNTVTGATSSSFSFLYSADITGTTTGTAVPSSAINPAIANLAVLGNCPATGNFSTGGPGSNVISFVYMNEVSTTAAAFALSGFGSGPFNVGSPSSTLAKTGLQIAASNAAQLYGIQGQYQSTTFAGEGHIANPITPAGNGIVPQSTLDTLGNILASCVDSANLTNSATSPNAAGSSSNCAKLFINATTNGIAFGNTGAGVVPTDIATAAFNIAHHPGSNVGSLFILQGTETTPFTPALSTGPNDFTIGIQYTAALNPGTGTNPAILKAPGSVAVDGLGNFWFTTEPSGGPPAGSNGYLAESSPLGVITHSYYNNAYIYGDVAIDSSNNAWTGNQGAYVTAIEDGPTTSYAPVTRGTTFTFAEAPVADNSATTGAVFFAHGPTNPPPSTSDNNQTLTEVFANGTTAGIIGNMTPSFNPGAYMTHGAMDAAGYVWFTSNTATYGNTITRVQKGSGLAALGFPINAAAPTLGCPSGTASTIVNPEQPAIDASGNAWIPINNGGAGNTVIKVTPLGVCTAFTVGASPYGAAIDGANNVWVGNAAGSLTEISAASGTTLSPSTNYTVGGLLSGPAGIAVDLSGDILVTNFTGNSVVEVIGAATPTYLPLGVAAGNNKLGATP